MTDAVGREKPEEKKSEESKRERESAWSPRCGADDGLIGWIRSLIVGGKEEDKEKRGGEEEGFLTGRKEGKTDRRKEPFDTTGNRINAVARIERISR